MIELYIFASVIAYRVNL